MKVYAEILFGAVRHIFEAIEVPYGMPATLFVEITNMDPRPEIGDEYDPGTNTFCKTDITPDPYSEKGISLMWQRIRNSRNTALNMTDYTQMPDFPNIVLKNRFKKYRQELRDIPLAFDDPYKVIFPIDPSKTAMTFTFVERLQNVWYHVKQYWRISNRRKS
jgi:hypothetical protein